MANPRCVPSSPQPSSPIQSNKAGAGCDSILDGIVESAGADSATAITAIHHYRCRVLWSVRSGEPQLTTPNCRAPRNKPTHLQKGPPNGCASARPVRLGSEEEVKLLHLSPRHE